jgi:hypothetical protein
LQQLGGRREHNTFRARLPHCFWHVEDFQHARQQRSFECGEDGGHARDITRFSRPLPVFDKLDVFGIAIPRGAQSGDTPFSAHPNQSLELFNEMAIA